MLSHPTDNAPNGDPDPAMHAILHARISVLGIEHDDLDAAIDALIQANICDDLIIARLKRRKLHIRDEIAGLAAAMSELPRQQAEVANG
jgi:hypothetical protein